MEYGNFINEINNLRRANTSRWYQWVGAVENKIVRIKGFGTWLQVFKVDGLDYSNPMERKVGEFLDDLEAPFLELHDDIFYKEMW
jgi:hypothetical protein